MNEAAFAALQLDGVDSPAFQRLFLAVVSAANDIQAQLLGAAYSKRLNELVDAAHRAVQED